MSEKEIRAAIQHVLGLLGAEPVGPFRHLAAGASVGFAASLIPMACSVYGIDGYDSWPDTTTTSTTSTTSHTTSTTSEPACDANIREATGATEECNACIAQNCCPEAEAYVAAPSLPLLTGLFECAVDSDESGPCAAACWANQCWHPLDATSLFHECWQCIYWNCCVPYYLCEQDVACRTDCVAGDSSSCCAPGSHYAEYDSCVKEVCGYTCPAAMTCEVTHQGAGGTGGGGGTGAVAGAGGEGGNVGGAAGSGNSGG